MEAYEDENSVVKKKDILFSGSVWFLYIAFLFIVLSCLIQNSVQLTYTNNKPFKVLRFSDCIT